jgi:hypothetical protein
MEKEGFGEESARAYTFSLLLPNILVILYCGCFVGAYNNDTTI